MSYHRTNINLFASDVEWLQKKYGHGWTERVRDIVRTHVQIRKERDFYDAMNNEKASDIAHATITKEDLE